MITSCSVTILRTLHQLISKRLLVAVQRFNHQDVISITATHDKRRRATILFIVYAGIIVLPQIMLKICSIYG